MFHLMAYNKDQDRYDEWQSGTLQDIQAEALFVGTYCEAMT